MDQKVHILALQKKTYASPRENMDAVRDMLGQYKGEKPDFLLLPEIFTCPYDNSCMESFYASLKKEYYYRREYATIEEVERDLFYYIEIFYNRSLCL